MSLSSSKASIAPYCRPKEIKSLNPNTNIYISKHKTTETNLSQKVPIFTAYDAFLYFEKNSNETYKIDFQT